MTSKEKLDVKIGSKEEAFWTSVEKKCKQNIIDSKREIIIQQEILELAQNKIEIEKSIFNK